MASSTFYAINEKIEGEPFIDYLPKNSKKCTKEKATKKEATKAVTKDAVQLDLNALWSLGAVSVFKHENTKK